MPKQNKRHRQMQSPPPAKRWQPLWRKNTVVPWLAQCKAFLTQRENWYTLLTAAIVFLAPTNLFYKFWEKGSYVHGLQIDYLIGKLYLSQILVTMLLGVWLSSSKNRQLLAKKLRQPSTAVLLSVFCLIGLRQLFTPEPLISVWQWCSLGLVGLLAIFLKNHASVLKQQVIVISVAIATTLQAVVGLFQLLAQHELLGYPFLGEPELSNPIGITHTVISGREVLLPYGTTAHPNVLAGFLAMYCLWLVASIRRRTQWLILVPLSLGIITLLLTTSVSGILTFSLGFCVLCWRKKLLTHKRGVQLFIVLALGFVPVLIHLSVGVAPHNLSLVRRDFLQQAGLQIFEQHALLGTGLQTVTREIEEYSPTREVVRFTQPTHHVGILLLSETGLLGGLLCILLLSDQDNALSLLALTPLLTLDHYLLTLWPGVLLFGISLAVFFPDRLNDSRSFPDLV